MADKFGPWIAFNSGDTPPDSGVVVQAQGCTEARSEMEDDEAMAADRYDWSNVIAYRIQIESVRGEAVYDGTLRPYLSMFPGRSDTHLSGEPDYCRLTFPTADGLLIPGIYTGPDGATIKIEMVEK
jgi:hypothetical protein